MGLGLGLPHDIRRQMAKEEIVHGFFDRQSRIIKLSQLSNGFINGKHRLVCPLVDIPSKTCLVLASTLLELGLCQREHQRRHQNLVPRFYHKLPYCVEIHCIMQKVSQTEFLADYHVARSEIVGFHLVHVIFLALGTTTASAAMIVGTEIFLQMVLLRV